jgi:hypothetical protein
LLDYDEIISILSLVVAGIICYIHEHETDLRQLSASPLGHSGTGERSDPMKAALCLLMVVACSIESRVRAEEGDKPSPLPEKLQKEAEKAFAAKKLFYIWADQPSPKFKDLRLKYAVNPDLKEEEAHRVIKLTYRARTGQIPWTGTEPGITSPFGPSSFKGQGVASIYLIKEADILTPKGVNPNPEKVPPRSNTLTVKVAFE